jgi:hypothetical protein
MLIALLAVPGVDLVVIVVLVGVLARRRWVSDKPGAFRIVDGEVPGLGTRWMRGYGRWVREILVWMKAPFLFRSELVVADAAAGAARAANRGEVRCVGKHAAIVALAVGGADRGCCFGRWV